MPSHGVAVPMPGVRGGNSEQRIRQSVRLPLSVRLLLRHRVQVLPLVQFTKLQNLQSSHCGSTGRSWQMTRIVRYGVGMALLVVAALRADVGVALLIAVAVLVIPTPTDKSANQPEAAK